MEKKKKRKCHFLLPLLRMQDDRLLKHLPEQLHSLEEPNIQKFSK